MRYSGRKGWVASYRDTWSLDYTLSPIILAALKKFYSLRDKPHFGVPSRVMYDYGLKEDEVDLGAIIWESIIENMIYAFDLDNEPDINKYPFKLDMKTAPIEGSTNRSCTITASSEEEYAKFKQDQVEYYKLRDNGLELFGKYFTNLWW